MRWIKFDPFLLKKPSPWNDESIFRYLLKHIKENLLYKTENLPSKKKKCEKLLGEIDQLYHEIEEKKKRAKSQDKAKMPFERIRMPQKGDAAIWERYRELVFRSPKLWEDDEV